MENKIKHLEMIQSIITRMAQNSFMIKGWSLTLVVAMFAFVPKTACLFIYLQLERRYKKLYDMVREKEESDVNFNLKITDQCKEESNKYSVCLFSRSILLFYSPVLIACVGIILALFL